MRRMARGDIDAPSALMYADLRSRIAASTLLQLQQCTSLQAAWTRVWDDVGDAGAPEKCGETARALPLEFVQGRLAGMQSGVSRAVADRAGAAFMARCNLTTPAGRHVPARLRSCASGAGSA